MKSLSSDSGELQDSRNESRVDTHMVFQFLCSHLYQFYRIALVCRCLSVCVLVSERFLDPLNWRKKNIWIDNYSCTSNI